MLQPLPKPAPARQDRSAGKVIGEVHDDAYPIFLYESVLEEILEYSEADLRRELGGFLLGGVFEDVLRRAHALDDSARALVAAEEDAAALVGVGARAVLLDLSSERCGQVKRCHP